MLAPNQTNSLFFMSRDRAVMTTEITESSRKQLAKIWEAPFSSFSPRRMLISGAPPIPTREPKAVIRVTIGPQTPTPARAVSPISGIFPIYMRSTTL